MSTNVQEAAAVAEGLPYFSSYPNTAVCGTLANTAAGKRGLRRAKTKTLQEDCKELCKQRFDYAYNHYSETTCEQYFRSK